MSHSCHSVLAISGFEYTAPAVSVAPTLAFHARPGVPFESKGLGSVRDRVERRQQQSEAAAHEVIPQRMVFGSC
jgi:hypothetical protein